MTGVISKKVTFPGASGAILAGRIDRPVGDPAAYALFAHCFTCSKDVFAAARISSALAARGIGVLRFDFTGLGHSGGEFAHTNFSSNVADLLSAAEFLGAQEKAPTILIGHSLGGAAVLAAAPRLRDARAVVTINAPSRPAHVLALLEGGRDAIEREGEAVVSIGGRRFTITRDFIRDVSEQALLDGVHGMRKALLVFHAPRDSVVGIENAGHIFQAALHPKSFISLDDADHLLSRREDAVYVADVIGAWASRYVAMPAESEIAPGTVLVAEPGQGRFPQSVTGGRHRLRADEPRSQGGDDVGPGPYDYLLAALGACTSMTIRLYAERKGIPLRHVAVRLRHSRIHASDCAECETRGGRIDRIERDVKLLGEFDQETETRLMEIADRCPVHRTLSGEVVIDTRKA